MGMRVVILGAGFGGLEAARALARTGAEVTLVDRRKHHLFQPLLYQVATTALSPGDIAWPIRSVFRRQRNVTVLLGEVAGVDEAHRCVRLREGPALPYDALVVATGATHSYFGHDDWAAAAPGLKTVEDATELRRRVLLAFEDAERAGSPVERQALLTFVVVGGGPTGVEMAGALAELARVTLRREFRHIDPRHARVLLLEAGPRVLPSFPEDLSAEADRSLRAMGVEVRVGARVTGMVPGQVQLGEERIATGCAIWAAGVVASPAGQWLMAQTDRVGRVLVGPDLSLPNRPDVFVIGDTAAVTNTDGKPVPGIAPAAKQMGQYVGRVIAARMRGEAPPPRFHYRHHGNLATIGRRSAVVELDSIRLKGTLGWAFWCLAHVWYLIGFRSRVVVAFDWLWSYLTMQRGARLITGPVAPQPVPEAEGKAVEMARARARLWS